ncbi:MAG: hypothetical protein ACRYG2_23305 [Janthinobacterium lividum]
MAEVRAYALAVSEVRALLGVTGVRADELRAVAVRAFAPRAPPTSVRDRLGPIHRRVPGPPLLRPDDPTRDDLEVLLSGSPVPPARAAAVWRLVEAFVAHLAWSSVVVGDDLPTGLLSPVALPLSPLDGLAVGWCALEAAATVPALQGWLAGSDGWVEAAVRVGRPAPDLLAFRR